MRDLKGSHPIKKYKIGLNYSERKMLSVKNNYELAT